MPVPIPILGGSWCRNGGPKLWEYFFGPSFEIRYSMSPVRKGVLCHSSILGTIGSASSQTSSLSQLSPFQPISNVAHSSPQTLPSFPGHPISVIPLTLTSNHLAPIAYGQIPFPQRGWTSMRINSSWGFLEENARHWRFFHQIKGFLPLSWFTPI